MRQSACLVINPITVNNFATLFNCMPVDRASDYDGPDLKLFILVGWARSSPSVAWSNGAQLMIFFASDFQWCCLTDQGSPSVMQHVISVESSSLLLHSIET